MARRHARPDRRAQILKALKSEGGRASGYVLGMRLGIGHQVNAPLNALLDEGKVKRTGRRIGSSVEWALVEEE